MTREEMEKKYWQDMGEGSVDIIVNPDGSTITIPVNKKSTEGATE
jgi:hypothetical protein